MMITHGVLNQFTGDDIDQSQITPPEIQKISPLPRRMITEQRQLLWECLPLWPRFGMLGK